MKKVIKITFASITIIIGILILAALYFANKNYEAGEVLFTESNIHGDVYAPTGYGKKRPDDFPSTGRFITSKSEYIRLYIFSKNYFWWNKRNYIY